MSKIGDLIVRLRLQYKDYEKGLKEADKKTKGFGRNLEKAFTAAKLGFAAIGTAAIFMGKELIQASNEIGDNWTAMVEGMKGAWQSTLADIATYKPDFSSFRNFFKNEFKWIKKTFNNAMDAGEAAKEMAKAFDAEFELENSLKIQRAQIKGQLADLRVEMSNVNLSPEQRIAAAEKYKSLLEPLYEAEIRVRKNMLDAAVKAWLAGSGVDASVAEVTEFFAKIGTDEASMKAKYPGLFENYQKRKGDKANQPIFDAITNLASAESGLADELKLVNRSVNAITGLLEETAELARVLDGNLLPKLGNIGGKAQQMTFPDIIPDDWLDRNREKIDAAVAEAMRLQQVTEMMNQAIEYGIEDSIIGTASALGEAFADIENLDSSKIMAALLQPFANTLTQLGEILIAQGVSIKAFNEAFKSMNPYVAIAAGTALVAMGAALSSGIQKLGSSAGSGAMTSGSSVSSSPVSSHEYKSEQTIYVKGKISGADILIAGNNQQNKWNK